MSPEQFQPDDPGSFAPVSRRIRVSDDSVDLFARLTGDVSRLHVDEDFARRSPYGRRIVHGMLPLAYLPLLPPLAVPGRRASPTRLSARFAEPIFPGEEVTLGLDSAEAGDEPNTVVFNFTIRSESSTNPVTTGTVAVRYEDATDSASSNGSGNGRVAGEEGSDAAASGAARPEAGGAPDTEEVRGSGLLDRTPIPNDFAFRDLPVGSEEDALAFRIGDRSIATWFDLLAEGVPPGSADPEWRVLERGDGLHPPSLLQTLLLSTSVGVSMPGNTSTFLDLDVSYPDPPTLGGQYRLSGTVTRRSKVTRVVKKRVVVTDWEGRRATLDGRLSILVNDYDPAERSTRMSDSAQNAPGGSPDDVVMVTGSSRGLGEAVAGVFRRGARVVNRYDRPEGGVRSLVDDVVGSGGVALVVEDDEASGGKVRVFAVHERTAGTAAVPAKVSGATEVEGGSLPRRIVNRVLGGQRKRALKARLSRGRQWFMDTFRSYDVEGLRKELARAGIQPGDSLMVHANFYPDNGLKGGPEEVVQALREAVGEEGTLMMVSIPFQETAFEYLERGKTFKLKKTVSMMGLVTETFRRQEGTLRSLHPTHSVLAVGKHADWLVKGHEECLYPCGDGSPYAKFRELHGKILCFDVDFGAMTFFHHVEDYLKDRIPFDLYEDRVFSVTCIDGEGNEHVVKTYAFNRGLKRMLSKLEAFMDERRLVMRGRIGNSRYVLVSADEMLQCHADMLEASNYPYDV